MQMAPYEFLSIARYLPDGFFRSLAMWLTLAYGCMLMLRKIFSIIFKSKERTINHLAENLLMHDKFKPIKDVTDEFPRVKEYIELATKQSMAYEKKFKAIGDNIEELKEDNRELFLLVLGNSLTKIYRDLTNANSKEFNIDIYQDFIELSKAYEAKGGNGMIPGYKKILEARWEEYMKNKK